MTVYMDSELQGRFELAESHLIIQELDALCLKHARNECDEITHALWNCKMKKGSPVSGHAIKISGYGHKMDHNIVAEGFCCELSTWLDQSFK